MSTTDTDCTCPSGNGSLRWPCPTHPPTQPAPAGVVDRETLARKMWESVDDEYPWEYVVTRAVTHPDADYAEIRDHYLTQADAVLAILPGRTVAQVKAEGLRELAATVRASFAPSKCPWVGALDDEATRLEREDKR